MTTFNKIRYGLQGGTVLLVISVNTIVMTSVLFVLSIFKFLAPKGKPRNFMSRLFSALAELWISINNGVIRLYRGMKWDIQEPGGVDLNDKSTDRHKLPP